MDIDFKAIRSEAIEGTHKLFARKHADLSIDLSKAICDIDGEIDGYQLHIIDEYSDLINAGQVDKVLSECQDYYDTWMGEVNSTRSDCPLGSRHNDVAFFGGNETANVYCFQLFLAKLNLAIIKWIHENHKLNIKLLSTPQPAEVESKLGHREIALIYYYEGLSMNEGNSDDVLRKYGWEPKRFSGKSLVDEYKKVKAEGNIGRQTHKHAVKNLKNILSHLKSDTALKQAQYDLERAS